MLKTGWKNWDKNLSQFVNKENSIMELGSYTGMATSWFLTNLCSNPKSIMIAIDTWEGSPEYTTGVTKFHLVEKEFDENTKKTGRHSQLIKIKMLSHLALIKIKTTMNYKFNIIFIDASHTAKDVLTDAVLSWDLLVEGGILIFDDYEWDIMDKDYFRPKIAIDSFINIFKPQLDVIYKGYQIMIQKRYLKDEEQAEIDTFYKIINNINKYI